jgi:deoxyribonuclease IV
MPPTFGAHMSIAGGHDRAARAAHRLGFDAVQLFTKSSNQWRAKPLTEAHVAAFRTALDETGIVAAVAHDSYLINLGSPDDALWARSVDALTEELGRTAALGLLGLVCHPGAHMGAGEEAGLDRVARGLDEVHRRTRDDAPPILLETTAGQGTCLGHRFEHLGGILERVAAPGRLGICVDTCHIFAAGYSLTEPEQYNTTIAALDRAVGLERVRVWHLNDSQRAGGSRVDRHAGIGRGRMGLEPFRLLVNDPRFAAVPMILETPKGTEGGEDLDAINLRVLRQLRASGADPP